MRILTPQAILQTLSGCTKVIYQVVIFTPEERDTFHLPGSTQPIFRSLECIPVGIQTVAVAVAER